jgi:hypothetical protein
VHAVGRCTARECDVESPLESPPEELTRLRDTLNELRDIMARPALWAGGAPPSVAQLPIDTLFGIASELEERVAERARALVAANEALRRSERNSRLAAPSSRDTVAASGRNRTTDQEPRSGCRFLVPAMAWPSRRREGLEPIPRCNGRTDHSGAFCATESGLGRHGNGTRRLCE